MWAVTNLDHFFTSVQHMFCVCRGEGGAVGAVVYRARGNKQGLRAQAPRVHITAEPLWTPETPAGKRFRFPVNLNKHICNVLRAEEAYLSSHIAIRRRVDPDLWPVSGDERLLQKLVLALALNAVDAIEDDGRVTLETRNLRLEEGCVTRVTGLEAGPYVLLTVEDTGRGLSAETLARVFTPVDPSERFSNRPVLAGVKRIADLHGGHVCVSSTPGEGTVVRVYLPAGPPRKRPNEARPAREGSGPRNKRPLRAGCGGSRNRRGR
ncbi:MAG: ATP-binding protein [Candidatus Hydrogenedentota bacterium]